ncbi:MAG: Hint domain-containing protein [Verrucomicrobiota bacterium]
MNLFQVVASFFRSRTRFLSVLAALALPLANTSCALIGAGVATASIAAGTAIALAPLKLAFACLPEGTLIDTPAGPQAIETLRAGDYVIGYSGEQVRVQQVHGYLEDPENSEFYEIGFSNGTKVDLCRMHRIGGIRAQDLKLGDEVEEGISIASIRTYDGVERSYDLLTEDEGYRIGDIPVNSMIVEMYETGHSGEFRD